MASDGGSKSPWSRLASSRRCAMRRCFRVHCPRCRKENARDRQQPRRRQRPRAPPAPRVLPGAATRPAGAQRRPEQPHRAGLRLRLSDAHAAAESPESPCEAPPRTHPRHYVARDRPLHTTVATILGDLGPHKRPSRHRALHSLNLQDRSPSFSLPLKSVQLRGIPGLRPQPRGHLARLHLPRPLPAVSRCSWPDLQTLSLPPLRLTPTSALDLGIPRGALGFYP